MFSVQFEQAADNLLAWLTEAERKMLSLGEIRLEQDQTTAQLQAQKVSLSVMYLYCVSVYMPVETLATTTTVQTNKSRKQ